MSETLWMTPVLRRTGDLLPAIVIQEDTDRKFAELVRLIRRQGVKRVSPAELQRWAFSAALDMQVDVADGMLARVHLSGVAKSIVPDVDHPVNALWMFTARDMPRVLIVAVPPETVCEPVTEDGLNLQLRACAARQQLWAGLATLHVDRVRKLAGLKQVLPR